MNSARSNVSVVSLLVLCGVACSAAAQPIVVGFDEGPPSHAVKFMPRLAPLTFHPYPGFVGGIRVAIGDVNDDGVPDIITGAGAGAPGGHVKVFNGVNNAEIRSFFAYGPGFTGGVYVATGDVNGDGKADIITGSGAGGGPHVKVFDGQSGAELHSFFAFGATFAGGIRVASGDVNGDGRDDIITGAGAGAAGGHVKVFDGRTGAEIRSFFAFPGFQGGVFVAAGDITGDGLSETIVAPDEGGPPIVRVFDGSNPAQFQSFIVDGTSNLQGVRVGTHHLPSPVEPNGIIAILIGLLRDGVPTVLFLNPGDGSVSPINLPQTFDGTHVFVAGTPRPPRPLCEADFNGDGNVDPDDLGDFINCYFSIPPCPRADFNGDGNVDPDDLGDFINVYFAADCE